MSKKSTPDKTGQVTDPSTSNVVITDQIPRIAVRVPDGAIFVPASEVPPGRDTGGYERIEVIIIPGNASLAGLARLRLDDASTLAVAQIAASFPKTDATIHPFPTKGDKP